MTGAIEVPALVRGEEMAGCRFDLSDGRPKHQGELGDLVLAKLADLRAANLADLQALSLDEILAFLDRAGRYLEAAQDALLGPAYEAAAFCSSIGPSVLREQFRQLPALFVAGRIRAAIERAMEPRLLDGWVEYPQTDPDRIVARRAFGARAVHIIAGNSPSIAANSIIRSAVTRSDSIIKIPSTDPLTAIVLLKALARADRDHPVVKHLSAAYWKGGDRRVEKHLLGSRFPEKIVAWGGLSSIKSAMQYVGPDTEIITFNPKLSRSIVDITTASADLVNDVADKLARDIASIDQEACFNTRIAYVIGSEDQVRKLARQINAAISALPPEISSHRKPGTNSALAAEISGLAYGSPEHEVFRGPQSTMIASFRGEPVDFSTILSDKVCNLVMVQSADEALGMTGRSTQTLSVYPDTLRLAVRDRAALQGVQRIVSCGAARSMTDGGPHDGMEPLRRLCIWAVDEMTRADRPSDPAGGLEPVARDLCQA